MTKRLHTKIALFAAALLMTTAGVRVGYASEDIQYTDTPEDIVSASVNPGHVNGSLEIPSVDIPDLGDARNMHKRHIRKLSQKQETLDNAVRSHAQEYGLQLGLAWGTKLIDARLNALADKLSDIYDFNDLLISDPSGHYILPPIITERDDSYELSDEGQTLKVADKTYTKEESETFSRNAPMWHQYLYRSYDKPQEPDNSDLPSTVEEQDIWNRYVTEGFNKGVRQAVDIFKADIRRLNHDYIGMTRYYELAAQGAISRPFVAKTDLGLTGNNDKVNYNQREMHISGGAHLNFDRPDKLDPTPSTQKPGDAILSPSVSDTTE